MNLIIRIRIILRNIFMGWSRAGNEGLAGDAVELVCGICSVNFTRRGREGNLGNAWIWAFVGGKIGLRVRTCMAAGKNLRMPCFMGIVEV